MTCHPFLERYITISISRSLKKREREREKLDPNYGTNYGSSSLLISKITNSETLSPFPPLSSTRGKAWEWRWVIRHVVQNRHVVGTQETHWDRKAKQLLSLKMVIFQCAISWLIYILTKAWNTTAKAVNDQCSSTLDQSRSWSVEKDKNRIKVKKTTAKTDQTTWKRLRYKTFLHDLD